MTQRGRFITFEGGEGSGKTTQLKRVESLLQQKNIACVLTREPGGTPQAEAIRALLLQGKADDWNPYSETLLFQAARIQHVVQKIRPALLEGKWVLCDRFLDSTLVYQGVGKGLSREWIQRLYRDTIPDLAPDLTILLDIDPELGLKRAKAREGLETRFEYMDIDFHRKVRQGFLDLAAAEPSRIRIIDATQSQEQVFAQIAAILFQ